MGGCASATATTNTVVASKNSIAGSQKNWSVTRRHLTTEEKECLNFLDKLESEANEVLEDFYALEDQYSSKIESILEKSQIYSSTSLTKLELLKQIQESKVPFQQERLVEIVHLMHKALPNIILCLQSIKKQLQTDPKLTFDSKSDKTFNDSKIPGDHKSSILNKKYSIIYKIDEARVEELFCDVSEWHGILQIDTNATYQDFQERKRLSHQNQHGQFSRSLTQRRSISNFGDHSHKNLTTVIPKRTTFLFNTNNALQAQPVSNLRVNS